MKKYKVAVTILIIGLMAYGCTFSLDAMNEKSTLSVIFGIVSFGLLSFFIYDYIKYIFLKPGTVPEINLKEDS